MKTKPNISAERKRKAEAYKKLPVALIERPLNFIRGGKVSAKRFNHRCPSWVIEQASYWAKAGNGGDLQRLARQYL